MDINCIIIESDKQSREILKNNLDKFNEFKIVGESSNAIDGMKILEKNNVDLMILDMDLPDLKGTDLINSLINPPSSIVISESSKYAIDCYELNVIDYLLKPITNQRFIKALNKFKNTIITSKVVPELYDTIKDDTFRLEISGKTFKLDLKNIVYVESMREYIKIHYENEEVLTIKYVLTKLEDLLPKPQFVRVHRSYIVSSKKIKAFSNKYIELADKRIPIGTYYRSEALKVLAN